MGRVKRPRLFEFEDLAWFPRSIRDAGTDFLRFAWEVSGAYKPIAVRLAAILSRARDSEILDLGSGGGGPIAPICAQLAESGQEVRITLSDKFPNLAAFEYVAKRTQGRVRFIGESVDATAVPADLPGVRTLFGVLHHFPPPVLRDILQDAVNKQRTICAFDFSARTPPPPLIALLGNPLGVLLATPFVRPFRSSRLLWTYVIPIMPLFYTWDALVSGLRLYSVNELQEVVSSLQPNDYAWEIEREAFPRSITCLVGRPNKNWESVDD